MLKPNLVQHGCVCVQNIPCRTKGCRGTVLPPEAPTVTSHPVAPTNQIKKVLHCSLKDLKLIASSVG